MIVIQIIGSEIVLIVWRIRKNIEKNIQRSWRPLMLVGYDVIQNIVLHMLENMPKKNRM